jgi:16S rRNA (guanine966-N2)-methyltransferase
MTRPVLERTRISLFSSLGCALSGKSVADIFAGSGILGFEAAARGASKVLFIEDNHSLCRLIKSNAEHLKNAGVDTDFTVIKDNVLAFFSRHRFSSEKLDYIFLDPPYAETEKILKILLSDKGFAKFAADALLIIKIPEKIDLDFLNESPQFKIKLKRRFAGTDFIFLTAVISNHKPSKEQ